MKPIRIALTKGRLEKDTVALFQKLGFDCEQLINKGRKLILEVPDANLEVVLAKAADVITYVEHGACDMGVVGKDTIMEYGGSFFEVLDLGFGRCRFALAAKKGNDFYGGYAVRTIASKYPNVTGAILRPRGWMWISSRSRARSSWRRAVFGRRNCGYRGDRYHAEGERTGSH